MQFASCVHAKAGVRQVSLESFSGCRASPGMMDRYHHSSELLYLAACGSSISD